MKTVILPGASSAQLRISASNYPSNILGTLGPTLEFAAQCQNIIGSISVFLSWQAYWIASLALANAFYASRILALQAYIATRYGAFYSLLFSGKALFLAWNCKSVQWLRKAMFMNFAFFILGSGQTFMLVLFWPGWLIVGGATLVLWQLCG